MRFIKLLDEAVVPKRPTIRSAGYNLHSIEKKILLPNEAYLFHTGIAWKTGNNKDFEFDESRVGIIKPRNSHARRYKIDILGGVINSDDTEEIKVILVNHGCESVPIFKGDKIAQLLILDFSKEADDIDDYDPFNC